MVPCLPGFAAALLKFQVVLYPNCCLCAECQVNVPVVPQIHQRFLADARNLEVLSSHCVIVAFCNVLQGLSPCEPFFVGAQTQRALRYKKMLEYVGERIILRKMP